MRKFKFRAWEKHMKEIIPVYNINFEDGIINTDGAWRMFTEIVLMQWTGLQDKNGVDIYEGDILRYPAKDNWETDNFKSYAVFFDDRVEWGYKYKLSTKFNGCLCGGYPETDLRNIQRMEIIGNIFENPELLKGEL